MSKSEYLGLKRLRKITGKEKYHCNNCNCDRFSPCGCMKKEKKDD